MTAIGNTAAEVRRFLITGPKPPARPVRLAETRAITRLEVQLLGQPER